MHEITNLINEMSPYLLLGFLLAGIMHAFIPGRYYTKYLSRPTMRSVIYAALFGIPLPLCSCGVIPTAMSLRKEGASKGAVASFLIATPQTGIDSIIATFSLMGLPFAVIRPFAALVTAVFGGWLVNLFRGKDDELETPSESKDMEDEEHHCCCHHHNDTEEHEEECCCHHHHEEEEHEEECCCHHHHKEEEHEDGCCGGTCHCHDREIPSSFSGKVVEALRYAFIDMMGDIGKWLAIGLVVAGLITVFVPAELFAVFNGNTFASMLLVLCIAIPMYLCATGSIPIALALVLKGLTPGAALVLLMAGPACNMASILVIRKGLGMRTMIAYLASIVIGSILFGCLIDWLQFSNTVDFLAGMSSAVNVHEDDSSIIKTASSVILAALLLYNAIKSFSHSHKHCSCH